MMRKTRTTTIKQNWNMYKKRPGSLIMFILIMLSVIITVGILLLLIGYILINGIPNLKPELFEWEFNTDNMSMMPAIISTVYMTVLSLIMAVPIGIFSAIHLTEYAKKNSRLVKIIRTTTETLSGIPSIVYGLFGYILFVITLGWSYSLIAGAVTLAIMILPLIMRTTEEALMSVPDSYREGSFGLGAGKLYTVFRLILPCAVPGILAGVILAIGRIVGEVPPLYSHPAQSHRLLTVCWILQERFLSICTPCCLKAFIPRRRTRLQSFFWFL